MTPEQEHAELLPCPFCGAGKTEIREDRPWLGMRYGEPSSVSVRHWCDHVDGQPSRMIERVGRDRAAAIDAWNRRAALQSQDREDAERYRWVKRHAHPNRGFDEWCLPCVDYVDDNLDAAIDHARRIEVES